ncbi:type I methionyl aminopeptidase, partial [uncultured Fibrobacter sp.]|uniref:type I methionyl aminopeptidase n=1 Tax=uncultured Fibrobacter sp. TaxID=261512 RepID=UPI00261B07BC
MGNAPKNPTELKLMLKAGELAAQALELAGKHAVPGISTLELDRIVADFIKSRGGSCPCKGYGGFPAHNCFSINEELIHGIPSKKKILKEGDIVKIDVGAIYRGYNGDSARTFPVGRITSEAQRLIDATKASFFAGMEKAVAGGRIGDVGSAVENCVKTAGFSVVRSYVG